MAIVATISAQAQFSGLLKQILSFFAETASAARK
jgi:hypothetical protein